ncbi:MAG: AAA family ATPase [Gammaproteobacteria bacterium]|nr:AAA family ATPase [Gammaproteobacteria bacterium]
MNAVTTEKWQPLIESVLGDIDRIVLGKRQEIRLSVACLLAQGHLLIEDLPGVGKTTLAHTLAKVLGLDFQRVQFTADMLPADILGSSIYHREQNKFLFRAGPIFTQLVLADEINRATPRTQSALLEAMEERQVSIEGRTRPLPSPFFVIATQNPQNQIGTFPLPESQLDRFLMRVELGYLDDASERQLLKEQDRRVLLENVKPKINVEQLLNLQSAVRQVQVSDALLDYVQRLLNYTRQSGKFIYGLSPRAGLGIKHAAQAWALLQGRAHVLPADVQMILPNIAAHRLRTAQQGAIHSRDIQTLLINHVAVEAAHG